MLSNFSKLVYSLRYKISPTLRAIANSHLGSCFAFYLIEKFGHISRYPMSCNILLYIPD